MSRSTDCEEIHEKIYQSEILSGATAWGGITEKERLDGWLPSLTELLANDMFPKSGELLELGSGFGTVSRFFARNGYITSGIEISRSAVEKSNELAEKQGLNFKGHRGTVSDLSQFSDSTFDAVIDGTCLHCVIGQDRKKTFNEVFRILKPGGFFFVSTNCGLPKEEKTLEHFNRELNCTLREGKPYRYFGSAESILEEIQQGVFSILQSHVKINSWWDHLVAYAIKDSSKPEIRKPMFKN